MEAPKPMMAFLRYLNELDLINLFMLVEMFLLLKMINQSNPRASPEH
jgi:hypothetical protein